MQWYHHFHASLVESYISCLTRSTGARETLIPQHAIQVSRYLCKFPHALLCATTCDYHPRMLCFGRHKGSLVKIRLRLSHCSVQLTTLVAASLNCRVPRSKAQAGRVSTLPPTDAVTLIALRLHSFVWIFLSSATTCDVPNQVFRPPTCPGC